MLRSPIFCIVPARLLIAHEISSRLAAAPTKPFPPNTSNVLLNDLRLSDNMTNMADTAPIDFSNDFPSILERVFSAEESIRIEPATMTSCDILTAPVNAVIPSETSPRLSFSDVAPFLRLSFVVPNNDLIGSPMKSLSLSRTPLRLDNDRIEPTPIMALRTSPTEMFSEIQDPIFLRTSPIEFRPLATFSPATRPKSLRPSVKLDTPLNAAVVLTPISEKKARRLPEGDSADSNPDVNSLNAVTTFLIIS